MAVIIAGEYAYCDPCLVAQRGITYGTSQAPTISISQSFCTSRWIETYGWRISLPPATELYVSVGITTCQHSNSQYGSFASLSRTLECTVFGNIRAMSVADILCLRNTVVILPSSFSHHATSRRCQQR